MPGATVAIPPVACCGQGFRVCGLRFGVWGEQGLGFAVWNWEFGVWVRGSGFWGLGLGTVSGNSHQLPLSQLLLGLVTRSSAPKLPRDEAGGHSPER